MGAVNPFAVSESNELGTAEPAFHDGAVSVFYAVPMGVPPPHSASIRAEVLSFLSFGGFYLCATFFARSKELVLHLVSFDEGLDR